MQCYMVATCLPVTHDDRWKDMKEYERRETWNIFLLRMSLRERADIFCKKTGRKRCVQLPEDKLLPFILFSDENQTIQVLSWFRSIQEALGWDDRECDLWFYTDGFVPQFKECHIPHQNFFLKNLNPSPDSNQEHWIWGEFHPREAPAGNWSHFGSRAPLLHLQGVAPTKTKPRLWISHGLVLRFNTRTVILEEFRWSLWPLAKLGQFVKWYQVPDHLWQTSPGSASIPRAFVLELPLPSVGWQGHDVPQLQKCQSALDVPSGAFDVSLQELIVVETYEDEPSSFLSGKAAWTSNMKVISC